MEPHPNAVWRRDIAKAWREGWLAAISGMSEDSGPYTDANGAWVKGLERLGLAWDAGFLSAPSSARP